MFVLTSCLVDSPRFLPMSGSRLTRKVTVESSKKISDSSAPRKSVFDRLGPGTVEVIMIKCTFIQCIFQYVTFKP